MLITTQLGTATPLTGPGILPAPAVVTVRRPTAQQLVLPPKPKNSRYESLTVWRGVACIMLVLYHATFYAEHSWRLRDRSTWTLGGLAMSCMDRMAMGVPMFFVVSGFCIAASIDSLRRRPHSLGNFFWRRFRRIYPPLWAAYALTIAFSVAILASSAGDACDQLPRLGKLSLWHWLGNLTASESWLPLVRGGPPRIFLLRNTWTLCYEEQFYAIAGLLLVFSGRRFFGTAYAIAAATFVSRTLCRAAGIEIDGFFFDGLWIMFAAGILVYDRLNYFGKLGSRITLGVLSAGAIYGAVQRIRCDTFEDRHFGEYILAASCFAMLLIWLRRWDMQILKSKLLKPIAWCGTISYSIFLTHYPIVVCIASLLATFGVQSDGMVFLITVPICAIASLPVAWLFYVNVERRFLNAPLDAARATATN